MAIDATFVAAIAAGLPEAAALKAMRPAEFLQTLEAFAILPNWNAQQTQAADYVSRMTQHEPGSPRFKRAVNQLINGESKRGLTGLTRRAAQQYTTLVDMGGDVSREFIWIVEGDESTCDPCRENAGIVDSYEGWSARGLPGLPTCDGGSYCRCDLFPVKAGE